MCNDFDCIQKDMSDVCQQHILANLSLAVNNMAFWLHFYFWEAIMVILPRFNSPSQQRLSTLRQKHSSQLGEVVNHADIT